MNSFSSSLQIIFSFLPLLICFSFFLIALSPSSLLFLLSTPTSFFTSLHLSPFIIGCSPLTSFILQSFQHFSFCPPFLPLDDYNTWDMSDSKWDWKRKHKEKQTGATPDWHIIEGEEEKKSMLCALQRRLRSVQGESSCFPSRPRLFVVKTWNVAAPSAGRTVEVVLTYFHGNSFACVMLGAPLVAPGNRL